MMELDIIGKVLGLKEQQWSDEREWRLVFELKPDDPNIRYQNGKPYIDIGPMHLQIKPSFATRLSIFL